MSVAPDLSTRLETDFVARALVAACKTRLRRLTCPEPVTVFSSYLFCQRCQQIPSLESDDSKGQTPELENYS